MNKPQEGTSAQDQGQYIAQFHDGHGQVAGRSNQRPSDNVHGTGSVAAGQSERFPGHIHHQHQPVDTSKNRNRMTRFVNGTVDLWIF